jgi:hypothetical protein
MNVVFPLLNNLAAIAEVNEESNLLTATPMGTSLIKRLRVASIRVLRINSKSKF